MEITLVIAASTFMLWGTDESNGKDPHGNDRQIIPHNDEFYY